MTASKRATIYYAGFIRWGGVLSHVGALEAELRRTGWDVRVVTLDRLPIWCRYLPHLTRWLWDMFDRPIGLFRKDRLTGVLYKKFLNFETDVRIFEDIYIGWNSETPSISILHAVWSDNLQSHPASAHQQEKLKRHEAQVIDAISHPIATVSGPYRKFIVEQHFGGRLSKEIQVVESGVDQSAFLRRASGNRKSIIYVGAFEPRKNVRFLLEVFRRLSTADSDYRLTLVGDGPDRDELSRFVREHQLNVSFLGSLGREAVASELPRHGVFLHPSTKESFSFALLEAKLAGLKTCASAELQVPEEFVDVPMRSFDVDEWCSRILSIDWNSGSFDPDRFKVERMTQRILELAR